MNQPNEPTDQFETRKRDHIELALRVENEAVGGSGLSAIELQHEALPDLNFEDIQISTTVLGNLRATPFLVSSMTAGHTGSVDLNVRLAHACAKNGWLMGVGSQRRELFDDSARAEWLRVRREAPNVRLLGNIGISQLVSVSVDKIQALVDVLEADAMIVHLNALQECLQPEGTPHFRGGFHALSELCKKLSVPVVVKETGCGFGERTLRRLNEAGVAAVDVSGFGGTHWGRIEGRRAEATSVQALAAETFQNWGISTVQSLMSAVSLTTGYEVWASGGLRTGLDAAKALALGANVAGFAKPILQAALAGEDALSLAMSRMEYELKTAMFCTGVKNLEELRTKKVWRWQTAKI